VGQVCCHGHRQRRRLGGQCVQPAIFLDSIGTAMYSTAVSPAIVPGPLTTTAIEVPPVLEGGDLSSAPASTLTPDQFASPPGRAGSGHCPKPQDLQGALDAQAQYTAERDQIAADILAAVAVLG